MAASVDQEAWVDSQKGLYVICIMAIMASTSYFFYVFVDKTYRFFYSRRRFIIFVLTAGDLFLALFSLIVSTRGIYERRYRPGCQTKICAQTYQQFYFPFVYATGLIVLCVEMVFRQRLSAFFPKREWGSVVMAGIPWIIGLVLILPLVLAGMDWDDCTYDSDSMNGSRRRAMVWVSVVLPSLAAVVCCAIVKQVKFNVIPKGRFPGVAAQQEAQAPHSIPQSQNAPSDGAPHVNVDLESEPNVYSYGDAPSQPQPIVANPQPAADNQPATYTSLDAPVVTQSQFEAAVEAEKKTNLILAVVFFVMVMPYNLFLLGYTMNDDAEPLDPVPRVVLNDLFYWVFVVRSVVTPILWARLPPLDI